MRLTDLEDVYELTPMQQGMMFHTLLAPESAQYFEQLVCDLRGTLDPGAFRRAWELAIRTHSIFRTSFVTDGEGKPVQVVHREAALPFLVEDWRALSPEEQQAREDAFLKADRASGFDLAKAPLMRLTLFRVEDDLHRLVWSRHHLLLDAWSRSLVFEQVFAAYEAFRRGRDFEAAPSRPYGDYIAWLQAQDMSKAQAHWREVFSGFPGAAPLELGPAPEPGLHLEDIYRHQELRISAGVTAKLRAFAREKSLTLNTLIQGAWAVLLGRYGDREDVVFGATMAGRPAGLEGVESMIGLFVNTLPVRVRLPADMSVSAWLQDLQSHQAELREYEYSPLVEVQKWSGVAPGASLFDTLLVFENAPRVEAAETERSLRASNTRGFGSRTNYPLSLLVDFGDHLDVLAVSDSRLYEAGAVERLLGHLRTVLEGMASRPEARVGDLPILSADEERRILRDWNDTAAEYPREECVHRMFEAQAKKTPEAPALFFGEETWSFSELDRRANRLAHLLLARGVARGDLIGVCVHRSPEMICALLAVLKAGAAYVPLDPFYPTERLAHILRDSGARIAIVDDRAAGRLPEGVAELLSLEKESAAIAAQPDTSPALPSAAGDLMYVVYTSGSTGAPKGVEAVHRASINRFSWMWDRYPFAHGEIGCLTSSLSFVDSLWQIFGPLLQGVPVRVVPDETVKDPALLVEALESGRVTRLVLVPSLLRAILDSIGPSGRRLPDLRQCVSSGEALPFDLARSCVERLPQTKLINLYGSSEVAADVTFHEVLDPKPPSIPIGRPIANTQIYILDSRLRPVPVGVAGGLYAGGDGVALGYRGRPDLTAERFLPDPFRGDAQARLYRTGDVARYAPDGTIEYLGRTDHQVKVRGHRVELAEVEAALATHPAIRENAVAARKDSVGTRLVAYVRYRESPSAASELRAYLQARLPEYMVPSLYVTVDEFPLTPNGKVDRAALPDPESSGSASAGVEEAPRSEVEALVASLWAEVLQVPRVGVHENFFELGGHSLLATRAVSRIRDSFEVELPLRALFEAPTVAGLAERIEAARRAADGITTAPLRKSEPRERYPLSFQQQRLWFVQQLEPSASHYNVQRALRLSGALDVGSLGRAVNEIVRRHESLRTIFVSQEGEPYARVLPESHIELGADEAEDLPAAARERRILEIAREEGRAPFDLSREAPLRVRFARLGSDDHVLILTLHHIVCDAWSLSVLIRELSTLYDAFSQGRESPLPELPIQYPDYAVWQRQLLTGEVLARLLAYWRGVLGTDRTPLALKTDRPRPAVQTFGGGRHPQPLPEELTARLKAVSREEGATLFMTLLAGFQALLARETGQAKIVVGTDIANRSRSETEHMIGFFVNLLVLSTDVSGNPGFRELLGRVRESALGAYAHQDLPFEKLVEELRPERDLSRNPLVQVLFVMQNIPRAEVRSPGLVLSGLDVGTDVARFDLAVFINETDEGLLANWVYNTDLFDASTIRGMAERYQRLLQSAGEGPDTRLENLEMITEAEKQRLADAKAERREAQSSRLKSMRRKGVDLAKMEDVKVGELSPGQACPLVVAPAGETMDLAEWAARERPFLEGSLLKHGAILFRGFGVKSADEFERFASGLCPELFGEYGDLPREAVGGKVYGSTPYPSDQAILFHNESSHMHRWPMKIFFYCVLPSQSGGETPIVDCRLVYQRLDPKLRERFAGKGLLYVRNYTERLDVSWQSFYGTEDRAQVEAACRRSGTEFEWTGGNGLRTRQRCPAVIRHPQTGEMSFFNQLQLHHVSCLDPAVRESLSSILREEDLPRNVYYGDGSRIEDSVMDEVGGVYRETSVAFPWQAGDVIMLNNMMTAHARNPYVGPRKIVVAMGEMIQMNQAAG